MWLEAVLAVPDGTAVPEGLSSDARRGTRRGRLGPAGGGRPVAAAAPTMLALRELWREAT